MDLSQLGGYALLALSVLGGGVLLYLVGQHHHHSNVFKDRLASAGGGDQADVVDPFGGNSGGWAAEILDVLYLSSLSKWYAGMTRRAGYFSPYASSVYFVCKLAAVAAVIFGLFALPPEWLQKTTMSQAQITLFLVMLVFFIPDYVLYRKVQAYRRQIEKDLPFWLDVHTSIVEGGVGFDEAVQLLCGESAYMNRPIFRELDQSYRLVALGSSRINALKVMADRLSVDSLTTVIAAIAQGEVMGAGMTDTLRSQADMVRNKVAEEAENRAQRLPTELTFPMALGVLPGLFLSTIGPPVIQLLGYFSQGMFSANFHK